jgi:hypothetical protein
MEIIARKRLFKVVSSFELIAWTGKPLKKLFT